MAAGTFTLYDSFAKNIGNGTIDLDSDTLKVALMTNSYTPNKSSDEVFSELSGQVPNGNGYTSGGATLTNVTFGQTGGVATLDAADVTWTASGGNITARYAVVYSATADRVIGYFLLDDSPADVTVTAGNTLTITWHADGILTISV